MVVPPEFIEDLRQRIPLSDIIGKRVKLVRKGRRHSGLCPFHSEKTPSFSVVDDQGFYHCFGCGAHGDAISFLRETDGLDFMEAVERLAGMAGLAVPRSAPEDPDKQRQRKAALDILEETTRFFQAALTRDDGAQAARYLQGRGLGEAALSTYRLGCRALACARPCRRAGSVMMTCWLPVWSAAVTVTARCMTISVTG